MEILNEARAVYSEIQAVRHQLHRCPELGHREVETTRLIRACLEEYGAEVLDYGFPTGLAARIRGGHPGKLLALREDIDALPILENTGLPFASQTPGCATPAATTSIPPPCWAAPSCWPGAGRNCGGTCC